MIPTWFIFIMISVVALVSAELSQRISMKRVEDISAEANNFIVWLVIGTIGLASSAATGSFDVSLLRSEHLLYFALIGCVYFWGGTLFYSSYKGITAGEGSIIVTFSVVISTLLGIILLGEAASMVKFAGAALVLGSITILNYSKDFKFNKFTLQALAGAAIYGLAFTIDKLLVLQLNPTFYLMLFAYSIAIISLVFRPRTIAGDLRNKAKLGNFKQMFISGISFATFNLFTFLAYQAGISVGVADAINNTSVFGIIFVEFLFLKERGNWKRKTIAAPVAIAGVMLLVLVSANS